MSPYSEVGVVATVIRREESEDVRRAGLEEGKEERGRLPRLANKKTNCLYNNYDILLQHE